MTEWGFGFTTVLKS